MTALTQFERLEAPGVWRAAPGARLRDIVVSFGDASLILRDPRSEEPLSHWSLPAVTRLNPGQMPAIFAPGDAAQDEVVEIDDRLMVEAIERVHTAILASRPRPGRLRGALIWSTLGALALAAVIWLPGAVMAHAARIAPPASRMCSVRVVLPAPFGPISPTMRPAGMVKRASSSASLFR